MATNIMCGETARGWNFWLRGSGSFGVLSVSEGQEWEISQSVCVDVVGVYMATCRQGTCIELLPLVSRVLHERKQASRPPLIA